MVVGMEATFYGAARAVTGSCALLKTDTTQILVDCGLPQGGDEKAYGLDLPFKAREIDFVLLTHAHIDHSGRIPLLVKNGFNGRIVSTKATADLCAIMLADSGHIQEMEVEWTNRKHRRAGKPEQEPLYTVADAQNSLNYFEGYDYGEKVKLAENLEVRFIDAGHLLGSSSIEIWLQEGSQRRHLVFSGDVGNFDQPLINDPEYVKEADFVIIESTYGDRQHPQSRFLSQAEATETHSRELAAIIEKTFSKGGNVIIPSFAVGRTQELLYLLRLITERNYVPSFPQIPVFLDSPLAIEATKIFSRNIEGYFDEEAMAIVKRGRNPLDFPSLTKTVTADESKELNLRKESAVIISSSGMCEAGRIKHHLKHNLWRPESTIVFCGYQAMGTLGRSILDGAEHVTIFGEQIDVRATITKLEGLSGHADQAGLINWLSHFSKRPRQIFVVHGEEPVARFFAAFVTQTLGIPAWAPTWGENFDLLTKRTLSEAKVEREEPYLYELATAYAGLEGELKEFLALIARFRLEKEHIPQFDDGKRAIRLADAVQRLSGDLENLRQKWESP